jgi:hypothetical protein
MNFAPGRDRGARTVQRAAARSRAAVCRDGAPTATSGRWGSRPFAGQEKLHASRVRVHPMDGAPEEITGRVLAIVPLRSRRNGVTYASPRADGGTGRADRLRLVGVPRPVG